MYVGLKKRLTYLKMRLSFYSYANYSLSLKNMFVCYMILTLSNHLKYLANYTLGSPYATFMGLNILEQLSL